MYSRTLPHTSPNGWVTVFRQALALDEPQGLYDYFPWVNGHSVGPEVPNAADECKICSPDAVLADTDAQEVWFSGRHMGASLI